MTALSADKARHVKGSPIGGPAMDVAASTTLYGGGLICNDTSGNAVPAADTASYTLAGVSSEKVDNSSGSVGDETVAPEYGQVEELEIQGSSLDKTDIGKNVFVQDDQTVTDAATATNDVKVGLLRGVSGGKAYVQIGVFGPTDS